MLKMRLTPISNALCKNLNYALTIVLSIWTSHRVEFEIIILAKITSQRRPSKENNAVCFSFYFSVIDYDIYADKFLLSVT